MPTLHPHRFFWMLLIAAALGMLGCGNHDSEWIPPSRIERIARSLSAAASFLAGQQGPDGAWRPDTYGAFKDGASLAPLILRGLLAAPSSEKRESALRKGTDYLAKMVQADGSIDAGPRGLNYPVY